MVAQSATSSNALDALASRIANPRPVSLDTLRRRHREAHKLCSTIRATLALLDVSKQGAAWDAVYRLVMRAEALQMAAYARWDTAWQEEMARRYEAQQLGEALMSERWMEYEMAGTGELDAALAWEGE